MSLGIKTKSVSVEDLGSIVKQMINGALENTAQIAKLHQVVYEEWYFKKMAELKNSKSEKTSEKPIETMKKNISPSAILSNESILKHKLNLPSSKIAINNYMNRNEELKNESNRERNAKLYFKNKSKSDSMLKNFANHRDINLKMNAQTRSLIHSNIDGFNKFNSQISMIKTKQENYVTEHQNIVLPNDIEVNIEKTNTDRNTRCDLTQIDHKTQIIKMKQEDKNGIAFENWKKQKNIKYKQMLKQEQKEKQQQLQAKLADMESKKLAQTYIRMKKQEKTQERRKISKELRIIEQTNLKSYQKEMEMKRIINDKVFKEWKKRKDIKLKEQKMVNRRYANYYQLPPQQQQQLQSQQQQSQQEQQNLFGHTNVLHGIDTKFNSWLNQLDWVLHEKYLRERRYLVRSFYCQPAYYGNAADIAYGKFS
ncbi:mRNA export factor GLE1-like [Vespula squamosa]|uniref:mRNA export factor GLE1-like n=1 Tax=Vespula squamosa TaxID=30214 RepID=A0ABD2BQ93_VESSQ